MSEEKPKVTQKTRKPTRPWVEAGQELLSDGEWHTKKEVFDHCGKFVNPGTAYRLQEGKRIWYINKKKGLPANTPQPRKTPYDQGLLILGGIKGILHQTFSPKSDGASAWFEWNEDKTMLRMRPSYIEARKKKQGRTAR